MYDKKRNNNTEVESKYSITKLIDLLQIFVFLWI